jgi:hypothetical protein
MLSTRMTNTIVLPAVLKDIKPSKVVVIVAVAVNLK